MFLGEWCKNYLKQDKWSILNYKILEYHWDNRKKYHNDYVELEILYEKYIKILTRSLNDIHNQNNSTRYWRIVIGPWLRYFIEILFDRYSLIINANSTYKIQNTHILKYNLEEWIPIDYQQFHRYNLLDSWNHVLFSEIIKFLNNFNYEIIDIELKPIKRKHSKRNLKNIARSFIIFYSKLISKYEEIFFVNSLMRIRDLLSIQISLNQFPNIFDILINPIKVKRKKICSKKRNQFKISAGNSDFEKLLNYLIPKFIPIAHLESYNQLELGIKNIYPENIKIIYTANAYSYDEGFKIWVASQLKKGTKFIIGQHGGRAGISKILQSHLHQMKICDYYISWGWKSENGEKNIPLPSIKLSNIKINSNNNGNILVLLPSYQRYFYHSTSMPIAGQCLKHFNHQLMVLKYLSKRIIKNYYFRLGPRGDAWDIKKRLIDAGLINQIDNSNNSFIKSSKNARLIIHSDNSTSLLESLSNNFPTLIYWDPSLFELTQEGESYFEIFHSLGIMHYSPESLSKKLNEVYDDVLGWWDQNDIRTACADFSNYFALRNSNYVKDWQNLFINLKKNNLLI